GVASISRRVGSQNGEFIGGNKLGQAGLKSTRRTSPARAAMLSESADGWTGRGRGKEGPAGSPGPELYWEKLAQTGSHLVGRPLCLLTGAVSCDCGEADH